MTPEEQALAVGLAKHFGTIPGVERLPGDASGRAFFRIHPGSGGVTRVLMVLEGAFDPEDSPFCQTQGLFAGIGIPVPSVELLFPEEGWVLMEDSGRETLQEYLERNGPESAGEAYGGAIDILLALHERGTREMPPSFHGAKTRLDREKLASELRFTWAHLLKGLWKTLMSAGEEALLDGWAEDLGTRLEATPQVLCHRDYHSRNLLWDGKRLAVIDFQDARLGPVAYDLASLLQDPYVDLGEDLKEEMFWRYFEGRTTLDLSEADLRTQIDLATVQRCLKAAGTYAFQTLERGRTGFHRYIAPATRNALLALRRFPEYEQVNRLLVRYAGAQGPAS